jgi:MFS family permease
LVARHVSRAERKKWWFILPGIPMRLMILIFAGAIFWLGEGQPAALLLAFLICYGLLSIGNGLVNVPWADLAGTSLNARWRARMFGLINAIASLVLLAAAPMVALILGDAGPAYPYNYGLLFGISGVFWVLSILPGLFIHELPGGAAESIPPLRDFLPGLIRLVRVDVPFRSMIITVTLSALYAMAGPFYIGFATEQLKLPSAVAVPILMAMLTIGSVCGGLLYTWIAAHSNILFIRLALGGAALVPISALLATVVGPWPLYVGFLVGGLTASTLFDGYQNWVITHAPADQRPLYVSLFNTVGAVIWLIAPIIAGLVVQGLGYQALFVLALILVLCALFVTLRYVDSPQRN